MGMLLDLIERLVTEHGSASVLRDHLELIKSKAAAIEDENSDLRAQVKQLQLDLAEKEKALRGTEQKLKVFHDDNPKGYACDHCGGRQLKRKGTRTDPMMGAVGFKLASFECNECGKISEYEEAPPR